MAQKHTFQTIVAEKYDGVGIGIFSPVQIVLPDIAMLSKQLVQTLTDPFIFLCNACGLEFGSLYPAILVIEIISGGPIAGKPVPGNAGLAGLCHLGGEFPEPGLDFCFPVHEGQGGLGGVLRTAQRGAVEGLHIQLLQPVAQQFRFLPAGGGQGVDGIIRIAVTDDDQFHRKAPFRRFFIIIRKISHQCKKKQPPKIRRL